MSLNRGDIALARFPHAAGGRGKKRPVVVVQSDAYNPQLRHTIVAEVTTNLATATDPANLRIDVSTPEGQATGLAKDSLVTCLHPHNERGSHRQGHRQAIGDDALETRRLPEGGAGAPVTRLAARGPAE